MDSKQIVIEGYDKIAETYHNNRKIRPTDWWDWIRPELPQSGRVLDAGCGGGVPIAKYFADLGYEVEGFDISQRMVELAQESVPSARFRRDDMSSVELPHASYDLIICSFALFHLPRTEHAGVLAKFYRALKPGGTLLISMGVEDKEEELQEDFHGGRMYWSMYDQHKNRELVEAAGYDIRMFEVFPTHRGEGHLWVRALKPVAKR